MAPKGWTTDDQASFLENWIPTYIEYQSRGDLNGFWPILHEAWFKKWPTRNMEIDPRLHSPEEQAVIAQALLERRKVHLIMFMFKVFDSLLGSN